ncbi:MAG TPA: hypothetical protein DDZ51_20040 [Planctomycetaceae bacterium]|nr:hypothetical protein [Planctomycetaceae bacterium]
MLEIRPFSNSDLPRLAVLWVIHHSVHRAAPAVTPAIWEQAIASRHFFNPHRLLVATQNSVPVAWCQWFAGANRVAYLAAICFDTSHEAEIAAKVLVAECQTQVAAAGMTTLVVGVNKESRWGYQGLEPIGQGIGVDVADDRLNQLLEEAGFEEQQRIDRWEVTTTDYRPAISREALVYRRGTRIEPVSIPASTPAESAAMFHFDIRRYRLLPTLSNEPLATADLWLSDPDIHVMSTHQSILGASGSEAADVQAREPAIRYLISSLIPILAGKHIHTLHRSVATDDHDEATRLAALKFRRTGAGRLLKKKL